RSVNLLTEQGRRELLDGRPLKALVYLSEAYVQGGDGPALRGLIASAARPADALEAVLRPDGPSLYWTAFTSDGSRLLSADTEGFVEVWRTEGHQRVERFSIGERRASRLRLVDDDMLLWVRKGVVHLRGADARDRRSIAAHDQAVMSVAIAPDGRVVTGSLDHTAKVFDRTGELAHTLSGHTGGIVTVAVSPDSRTVATGARDKTARLWDLETGAPRHQLGEHVRGLSRVLFSPDGAHLLTCAANEAWLWSVETGERVQRFEGHQRSIDAARFVGDRLLTAGHDNTARLWSLEGKSLLTFGGHDDFARGGAFTPAAIRSVLPAPDGAAFLTRGSDATVRIWDATTGGRLETLMGHLAHVNAMAVHPTTGQVATAGDEGKLILWKPTHGALRQTLGDTERPATAASLDVGGAAVILASSRVQLGAEREPVAVVEGLAPSFVARRGDRVLLADGKSGQAAVLDGSAEVIARLEGHAGGTHHGDLQPTGTLIATAGDDGAKLWRDGKPLYHLAHDQSVRFVRFSPNGKGLIAVERGAAKLWGVEDGKLRLAIPAPEESASLAPRAAFDPAGERVLMMTSALRLRIYATETGQLGLTLDGARGAFSPDGEAILVAATSPVVRVYDRQGRQLATLDGHTEPIVALGYFADGRAVTASRDGTVRIWDGTTGKMLDVLGAHRGAVQGAWLDPAGARVLTLGDGRAKLWSAPAETRPPGMVADLCQRIAPWELRDGHLVERPSR
ncbi:MAG: WD40 repeat domain-containing protein, partial [Deltaproteobacteria bacterium]|nr:WD40 repeat domain-containing protein [Deltaproteobacteria bacterium]MBW2533638.1 WD40 repeat domain-containing protein [Deltaproteobacteria bacterium]